MTKMNELKTTILFVLKILIYALIIGAILALLNDVFDMEFTKLVYFVSGLAAFVLAVPYGKNE